MVRAASITIVCPDQPGIVASVTDFLFRHHGNINALEEHTEDGYFFMRIEWELDGFDLKSESELLDTFSDIQMKFSMKIQLDFFRVRKRVGLLCSRELHCLVDILGRHAIGELDIAIPYIVSHYEDARDIAVAFSVPFFCVPSDEASVLEIIRTYPSDVVGLARYMKILSPEFLERAGQQVINVHHSFLPLFRRRKTL